MLPVHCLACMQEVDWPVLGQPAATFNPPLAERCCGFTSAVQRGWWALTQLAHTALQEELPVPSSQWGVLPSCLCFVYVHLQTALFRLPIALCYGIV